MNKPKPTPTDYREACAWAYQFVGCHRNPDTRVLDNLSALQSGRPAPHSWESLYPATTEAHDRAILGIKTPVGKQSPGAKKGALFAWSRAWLRAQSWKEIREMNAQFLAEPATTTIGKQRERRLFDEWDRRKREGGGGLAAAAPAEVTGE